MTPEAVDLIKNFLEPNVNKRLGSGNMEKILEHPFFKDIDWENLRKA